MLELLVIFFCVSHSSTTLLSSLFDPFVARVQDADTYCLKYACRDLGTDLALLGIFYIPLPCICRGLKNDIC